MDSHPRLVALAAAALVCAVGAEVAAQGSAGSVADSPRIIAIERVPSAARWDRGALARLPELGADPTDPWAMDLRSYDVAGIDMRGSLNAVLRASFDSKTVWPDPGAMPAGFDPAEVMELGRNPGLGVQALHDRGITGRGVGIAIIDQPLLTTHEEYADRLLLYEEVNVNDRCEAQMHGSAVASIAVGKTAGVAPEADLYYIATWTVDWDVEDEDDRWNFAYKARAIDRILELNVQLPLARRIRVISISAGWSPNRRGYEEITAAVRRATDAGVLVVSSSIEETHGLAFHGLGREPYSDPDDHSSYRPGSWWAQGFYDGRRMGERLLVPMDSRTTASPTGDSDYVFYRSGGWSWAIPYIAGLYALAAQVEPTIDPELFWETATRTGRTISIDRDGTTYELGPIVDPPALIEALETP